MLCECAWYGKKGRRRCLVVCFRLCVEWQWPIMPAAINPRWRSAKAGRRTHLIIGCSGRIVYRFQQLSRNRARARTTLGNVATRRDDCRLLVASGGLPTRCVTARGVDGRIGLCPRIGLYGGEWASGAAQKKKRRLLVHCSLGCIGIRVVTTLVRPVKIAKAQHRHRLCLSLEVQIGVDFVVRCAHDETGCREGGKTVEEEGRVTVGACCCGHIQRRHGTTTGGCGARGWRVTPCCCAGGWDGWLAVTRIEMLDKQSRAIR